LSNVNQKKNEIQLKGLDTNKEFGYYSTLAMCTGAGKSRCGVLRAMEVVAQNPNAKIFLAVPTEKLRDVTWKDEFIKWDTLYIFEKNLTRACYVSLNKYTQEEYDLVILDEAHHVTEACIPFFTDNEIKSIIGLTATPPKDKVKKEILNAVAPVSFIYPLEQGIADGIISPFTIDIIFTDLDNKLKYIEAGSKTKKFKQTEKQAYDYWDNVFEQNKEFLIPINNQLKQFGYNEEAKENFNNNPKNQGKDYILTLSKKSSDIPVLQALSKDKGKFEAVKFRAVTKRKTIILGSIAKEKIAQRFIEEVMEAEKRYLIFSGSIKQSVDLLGDNVFNSKSTDEALNKFIQEQINAICVCNALNEGANIPNLDEALIIQISAKDLHLIQRIGRVVRLRDNFIGKIYIIVLRDTVDERWLNTAIAAIKEIKITEYTEQEFFDMIRTYREAA
jgi:superfamily II DNA or RNA helicase